MPGKVSILIIALFMLCTLTFAVGEGTDPRKEAVTEIQAESDSLKVKEAEKVASSEEEEEEDSVSLLSLNMLFELLYHFDLSDLFKVPKK